MDKVICVGKNYLDHAVELGDAIPELPVLFLKPPSVLKQSDGKAPLVLQHMSAHSPLHFETEIVLRIQHGGYDLSLEQAQKCISHVTLGLDMTLRDRQTKQKKEGHPWTTSKVFPDAAAIGPWVSLGDFKNYCNVEFSLSLDGTLCQKAKGNEMRLSPAQCVQYISQYMPLCDGDVVFTGTPKGVGQVNAGQVAELEFGSIQYVVNWVQ